MMRLDDSREAGLLNPSTQYASLETSMRTSEFDMPMGSRRPKSRSRCYVASLCIALVAVAAIVSVSVGKRKGNEPGDETNSPRMRNSPQWNLAPAPSPEVAYTPGAFVASAPPAPPVEISEPVSSPPKPSPPLPPPQADPPSQSASPLAALAPSPSLSLGAYHLIHYDAICNKTIDPAVCLNLFASNPNSPKVDFQQWTIMTMQAAEQALNESYTLATSLKVTKFENVALEQCIDVFSEALVLVNESMYTLANMDVHNPGDPAADIQVALDAAMTDHDTCQDGIDDLGPFPGSDRITGAQARHVDTLLSISLTFVKELIATSEDPNHHRRRLLEVASAAVMGRRGLLATRDSQPVLPGRTFS